MNAFAENVLLSENTLPVVMNQLAGPAVLVVDDERNFLALLNWFLSRKGYEVRGALNGEEALRLVEQNTFDVALLDIRMGPVDGISLLDELRQRLPQLKVIMMTAYPTAQAIKQSYSKGASAFFTKPVNLDDLLRTIQNLS